MSYLEQSNMWEQRTLNSHLKHIKRSRDRSRNWKFNENVIFDIDLYGKLQSIVGKRHKFVKKVLKLTKVCMERVKGIEPSSLAWKARALPLSNTRKRFAIFDCRFAIISDQASQINNERDLS
jgi:hypothetical protein